MLAVFIMFVMLLAGSLVGDAVSAATVVGILTFGIFASMNIPLYNICCLGCYGGLYWRYYASHVSTWLWLQLWLVPIPMQC